MAPKKEPEQDQVKELTNTLQRLQAEFENYKKRIDKGSKDTCQWANEQLIKKLLPIVDSFEIALKNTSDNQKFVKGVELIFSQLVTVLKEEGLTPIDAKGKEFDPYQHEVLMQEKGEKENIILEELQKGYMLKDKIIRTTKVKVSK